MDQVASHLDQLSTGSASTLDPASQPRWSRRLRFSLRTLLITIAIVAVVLVVANYYVRPKLEHRIAVGRIFNSGGAIWFQDKSQDDGLQNPYTTPKLNLNLWGNANSIDVKNDAQAIVISRELGRIPEAGGIEFGRGVTDVGLTAVCESSNCDAVVSVSFFQCSISSDGLSKLDRFPKLRHIMFNTFQVIAAGLAKLKPLRTLRTLVFCEERPRANYNRLDDACFREISELVQLESLNFTGLNVSDTAARRLHNLKKLKTLIFQQGHISDAAITELRSELPTTDIHVDEKDRPPRMAPDERQREVSPQKTLAKRGSEQGG